MLARKARISPDERVVDVGCGTGASLVPASSVAASAVGIDLSFEMLQHVPWPVPLLAADAESLPLRESCADVVLAGFVLPFVPRPAAAAGELRRALRPGGRVVIGIPDAEIPACGQVKRAWVEKLGLPPQPARSPSWVDDALAAGGFDRVETSADAHTFEFATGHDYVAWNWSHGARALLEQIPETERPAFEGDLAAAAETERLDGKIPIHTTARFWVGFRPS